jgi:hypothetical protein
MCRLGLVVEFYAAPNSLKWLADQDSGGLDVLVMVKYACCSKQHANARSWVQITWALHQYTSAQRGLWHHIVFACVVMQTVLQGPFVDQLQQRLEGLPAGVVEQLVVLVQGLAERIGQHGQQVRGT